MKSKLFMSSLWVCLSMSAMSQEGSTCVTAIPMTGIGAFTAELDNTWFLFTAAESGLYNINTCELSDCDTKIWVYSDCPPNETAENAEGTLIYNDDFCGLQSNVNFVAQPGEVVLIRIGDYQDACLGSVDWMIQNLGEVEGCIDPEACNYNPLATTDNGSCISFDDPLCLGPDLRFDEDVLIQSLMVLQHFALNCDVEEGCVTGYNQRQVISFSSKIDNIGQQDYYIGNVFTNPEMFNTNNCHGHAHYEGYGDYKLIDMDGNVVPAGHKNGFCVMDLCGFGQYTCSDMGISSGCYDEYGAGTTCQWIDVTNIVDGVYRLVAIVNPLYLPDAVGRVEEDLVNNMTTVCLDITHDGMGLVQFEVIDECPEYVDCAGILNGNAWPDCNGDCNGSAIFGDVAVNSELDTQDLLDYLDLLTDYPDAATSCNDLSGNGTLTVYDIALNGQCQDAVESGLNVNGNCQFPASIISNDPSIGLSIVDANLEEGWIEVEMFSVSQDVLAYQFQVSGANISSVVSALSMEDYTCEIGFNEESNSIFAYSLLEHHIEHSALAKTICRIYFSEVTESEICISVIEDIVNEGYERTENFVYGACVTAVGIAEFSQEEVHFMVSPNPVEGTLNLFISAKMNQGDMMVYDLSGKLVLQLPRPAINIWNAIDVSELTAGLYTIVSSKAQGISQRFVKL